MILGRSVLGRIALTRESEPREFGPLVHASQELLEVIEANPGLQARITQAQLEMWSAQEVQAFITQFVLETVQRRSEAEGRASQLILEVLRSVGGVPIGCPQGFPTSFLAPCPPGIMKAFLKATGLDPVAVTAPGGEDSTFTSEDSTDPTYTSSGPGRKPIF